MSPVAAAKDATAMPPGTMARIASTQAQPSASLAQSGVGGIGGDATGARPPP